MNKLIQAVLKKLNPRRAGAAVLLFGLFMLLKRYRYRHAKVRDMINYEAFLTAFTNPGRSVWVTLLTPCELLFPLGLSPLVLESVGGIIGGLGLTKAFLKNTIEVGIPGSLCTFHRAHLAVVLKNGFPAPGNLLAVSALCDGNLRALQEAADLFGSPFHFIDMPEPEADGAVEYLKVQLEELYARLAHALDVRDAPAKLRTSLALAEETRLVMESVNQLRKDRYLPGAPSLGLSWNLLNHTGRLGSPGALKFYRTLYRDLLRRGKPIPADSIRLLLSHLPPVYNHPVAESLIKKNGLVVIEEFNVLDWEPFNPGDPFLSVAGKMLAMPQLGGEERRVERINRLCLEYGVHGILHFAHWGCRQSSGSIHALKKRICRPLLYVEVDLVDADSSGAGQTSTRVESFLELLTSRPGG